MRKGTQGWRETFIPARNGPSPASTPGYFWESCKAISSLGPARRAGRGARGCKVQLERKHSPEAEGICGFMTGAASSLRRSRLLSRLPCLHLSQQHPLWARCSLGLWRWFRPLVGRGLGGGSRSSYLLAPTYWAPPQLSLPGCSGSDPGLSKSSYSRILAHRPLEITGSCIHQPKSQNSKIPWVLNPGPREELPEPNCFAASPQRDGGASKALPESPSLLLPAPPQAWFRNSATTG